MSKDSKIVNERKLFVEELIRNKNNDIQESKDNEDESSQDGNEDTNSPDEKDSDKNAKDEKVNEKGFKTYKEIYNAYKEAIKGDLAKKYETEFEEYSQTTIERDLKEIGVRRVSELGYYLTKDEFQLYDAKRKLKVSIKESKSTKPFKINDQMLMVPFGNRNLAFSVFEKTLDRFDHLMLDGVVLENHICFILKEGYSKESYNEYLNIYDKALKEDEN